MKTFGFPLVIILVMVMTACSHGSQVADVPALQQTGGTWPRCISGCTANDVEINSVSLNVSAGNYTLGEIATHNVSMNLYFHRQNTYCIVVVADLYEGGVLQQTDWVSSIIGYHGGGGNYTYLMGTVNWTYGKLFEMHNVLVMWSQNSPSGGMCPTDCSEYTAPSKCNQPPTFVVTTPLVADFESDEVCFCDNTTFTDITTGGVKPYTWYWDFGDGDSSTVQNATHHFDGAGNHSVTLNVTDSDSPSTTASQSHNVTVYPNPTVNITPDGGELTCATTFIMLTADTTGSDCGVTSYQWYKDDVALGGQTDTTLNVTSPGDYKVEVGCANGCTDDDEVTVTQDISVPSVSAGPDQEVCEDGGPITLSGATPSGGTWGGTGVSGNAFDPSGLSPGDYTVTYSYTDIGTGCSNSDTKTVTVNAKPTADAGADGVITVGGSVVVGGTPTASGGTPLYTCSWSPTTGLDNASFANPTASPAVNTTYTVTVTDSNGCTDSDAVTVTVTQGCCIGGFVYGAGTMEPLAGWEVILERHTSPWVEIGSAITDASGKYLFCGLGDGEYRVSEVVQPGWSQVSPLPNQHLVALPLSCCDPLVGPFLNFQNQQGVANSTVGWEVSPVDRPTVRAPWIALFAAVVAGTSFLVLSRRRT